MARFRLYPTHAQEEQMLMHCAHARLIWNTAVEQLGYSNRDRPMPTRSEQGRQVTEARHTFEWLGSASSTVQLQALRDFHQACTAWGRGTHRRPTWRRRGQHEGFRITGRRIKVEKLNRRWSQVYIPHVGWVRLRRSRDVPPARSYRVNRDAAGRWHVAFAVKPDPIAAPGNGAVIGVDRGLAVTLAYSDGVMLHVPEARSLKHAQRALARCKRGSNRRQKARLVVARAHRRNTDRRRDFIEKATTDLARRADLIRVEDLRIRQMTRAAYTPNTPWSAKGKAGLNRKILASGWGVFVDRLKHKAPGRVEMVSPHHTSQRCAACGHVARESRESQALFRCVACGHTAHADVNAAQNIAAGRAVRGAGQSTATKREPLGASAPLKPRA